MPEGYSSGGQAGRFGEDSDDDTLDDDWSPVAGETSDAVHALGTNAQVSTCAWCAYEWCKHKEVFSTQGVWCPSTAGIRVLIVALGSRRWEGRRGWPK